MRKRILIKASFVEQLSTVKVDNLRSIFQSKKQSNKALESDTKVCGQGTYTNLYLKQNEIIITKLN